MYFYCWNVKGVVPNMVVALCNFFVFLFFLTTKCS
jgi:hypothetical protein